MDDHPTLRSTVSLAQWALSIACSSRIAHFGWKLKSWEGYFFPCSPSPSPSPDAPTSKASFLCVISLCLARTVGGKTQKVLVPDKIRRAKSKEAHHAHTHTPGHPDRVLHLLFIMFGKFHCILKMQFSTRRRALPSPSCHPAIYPLPSCPKLLHPALWTTASFKFLGSLPALAGFCQLS